MTNDEIREAINNNFGTTETQLKVLKELAEEYLKVEGWPEEKTEKELHTICGTVVTIENEAAYSYNAALHLCKLAAMKEKSKADIKCPFCSEDDFDLIGLKHHLLNYCIKIIDIKTIREA